MVKKLSSKKTSIKKRSSAYAPSSILGKIVSLWFLISISFMVLQSYRPRNYFSNEVDTVLVLSFLALPLLGTIVAWKNSEPENDGFFSRIKSLFTKGLWLMLSSIIFLFIGQSYLESYNTLFSTIFFILSFLSFWLSIGYNAQTKYSPLKRGIGDALAMSLGQIIIIFFVIILLAAIFGRLGKR